MNTAQHIRDLMTLCIEKNASDLHLSVGQPAALRIYGTITRQEGDPYSADQVLAMAESLMTAEQRQQFAEQKTLDMGFSLTGSQRFRINVYREMGHCALAIRYLDGRLKTLKELGLPPQIEQLTHLHSGLVLVCGATGSGKSTTLAALLNSINSQYSRHILTVEDPVEFIHPQKQSIIHQRELHSDVPDFASAVKASLREDPDVIMVGEMRDLETMRTAITAAETGHLVFSTLHTNDAVGVVDRLIGSFPGNEQGVARQRIAYALKAVIAQQLAPVIGGQGRAVVAEILMVTNAVSNLIESTKTKQIYSIMESGAALGMQTLDQALARLVKGRTISQDLGRQLSRDPATFQRLLG